MQRLAATGPLPTTTDLETALVFDEVLMVPTPEALPAALTRLRELTLSEFNLPPAQVELINKVTAEAALAAAAALGPPGDPVPSALRDHAHHLGDATGLARRIAPLRLGKGVVAAQAQHIHHLLESLRLRGAGLSPQIAQAVARALAPITEAVSNTADWQLRSGNWLMLRETGGPPRGQRVPAAQTNHSC